MDSNPEPTSDVMYVAAIWQTVVKLTAAPKGALSEQSFKEIFDRIQAYVGPHLDQTTEGGVPVALITAIWAFDRLALISAIGKASKAAAARSRTARAKAAAARRHIENHAMRRQVFDWLDANMVNHRSMDSAASAIAGRVVPVTWRTARAWVTDWKRDRSASMA